MNTTNKRMKVYGSNNGIFTLNPDKSIGATRIPTGSDIEYVKRLNAKVHKVVHQGKPTFIIDVNGDVQFVDVLALN